MKLQQNKNTVLVIPDMHHPFAHPDTVAFLKAVKERYKPNKVVCLGDEVDMHAMSFHTHDPDGYGPGKEHERALEALQPIYKMFPKVMVCISNHTARPFRRAVQFGIPKTFLREYKEFMEAPKGWEWANQWEIDNILYIHGEGYSGKNAALTAAQTNMQSTVIGHIHSFAGINYVANKRFLIFGLNAGCLINVDAYAFAYAKNARNKPIIGCAVVDKGIPMFIPMVLKKGGRWVGKL